MNYLEEGTLLWLEGAQERHVHLIEEEKSFNSELGGNEVYCTNVLLSLIKIMLCSRIRCQKVLN